MLRGTPCSRRKPTRESDRLRQKTTPFLHFRRSNARTSVKPSTLSKRDPCERRHESNRPIARRAVRRLRRTLARGNAHWLLRTCSLSHRIPLPLGPGVSPLSSPDLAQPQLGPNRGGHASQETRPRAGLGTKPFFRVRERRSSVHTHRQHTHHRRSDPRRPRASTARTRHSVMFLVIQSPDQGETFRFGNVPGHSISGHSISLTIHQELPRRSDSLPRLSRFCRERT